MSLNVLSLFAGIGGLELGLERAGMTTVGQVELDDYCRRVLAKHWPDVPRHDDVRTAVDWWRTDPFCAECDGSGFNNDDDQDECNECDGAGNVSRPRVDVICGGFPCQDISVAGKRAGIIDGERSSLWTYFAHAIRVLRPRYVLVENVSALLVRGLDVVAADLAEIGYDLRWDCVPAAAVGAPHRRDRWFGIAYPQRDALRLESVSEQRSGSASIAAVNGSEWNVADASSERRGQGRTGRLAGDRADWAAIWPQALAHTQSQRRGPLGQSGAGQAGADNFSGHGGERRTSHTWAVEPDVGRVAHGVPARVDRLRALGNAVVPQVAEHVGRLIVEHAAAVAA